MARPKQKRTPRINSTNNEIYNMDKLCETCHKGRARIITKRKFICRECYYEDEGKDLNRMETLKKE